MAAVLDGSGATIDENSLPQRKCQVTSTSTPITELPQNWPRWDVVLKEFLRCAGYCECALTPNMIRIVNLRIIEIAVNLATTKSHNADTYHVQLRLSQCF